MPHVLIRSHRGDVHAEAVFWALRKLGYETEFWRTRVFPSRERWSSEISDCGDVRHCVRDGQDICKLPDSHVVWNRRGESVQPPNGLASEDAIFAERESRAHVRALERLVAPSAFWVNPPAIAAADAYKPLQLRTAATVGFRIPDTLFSNDPDKITEFYRRWNGDVVFKSYHGVAWSTEGEHGLKSKQVNRIAPVLPEDLERREALSAAPGIFQRRIAKAFELRVTAMGRTLIAAKIDSQAHEATREDWRSGQHLLTIEPFELPEEIAETCRRYMRAAGLNFGCFDFIVTPEGEYVFLEVNQAGQFLWKEARCPELPMLQAFCDFLLAADPDFLWQPRQPEVTFADYLASDAGRAFQARTDPTESAKRLFAQA